MNAETIREIVRHTYWCSNPKCLKADFIPDPSGGSTVEKNPGCKCRRKPNK